MSKTVERRTETNKVCDSWWRYRMSHLSDAQIVDLGMGALQAVLLDVARYAYTTGYRRGKAAARRAERSRKEGNTK